MKNRYSQKFKSPLGEIIVIADDSHVSVVEFIDESSVENERPNDLTEEAISQLQQYFDGERTEFDLPLAAMNSTQFRSKVWDGLTEIPYGETRSYLDLAREIGDEKASRAVGNANGKNPIAIVVPCHRVVGSDGSLHGYASGVWRKKWLLEHEAINS